jgi:hypothetical protein
MYLPNCGLTLDWKPTHQTAFEFIQNRLFGHPDVAVMFHHAPGLHGRKTSTITHSGLGHFQSAKWGIFSTGVDLGDSVYNLVD